MFGYEPSSLGPRGGPFEDQIGEIADEVTKDVRTALAAAHPDLAVTVPPCSSSRTPERPTLTTDPTLLNDVTVGAMDQKVDSTSTK